MWIVRFSFLLCVACTTHAVPATAPHLPAPAASGAISPMPSPQWVTTVGLWPKQSATANGDLPRATLCSDAAACAGAIAPEIVDWTMPPLAEKWVVVVARENAIANFAIEGTTFVATLQRPPCPGGIGRTEYYQASVYRVAQAVNDTKIVTLPAPDCSTAPDVPATNQATVGTAVRFQVTSIPCGAGGEAPLKSTTTSTPPSHAGAPVARYSVQIFAENGRAVASTSTDANGQATLLLPAGRFCLTAGCTWQRGGFSLDKSGRLKAASDDSTDFQIRNATLHIELFGICPGGAATPLR